MNITPEQLMAVVMLRNHPAVEFTSINSHKSGNINIGISSTVDASQDEIDDALKVIFPTMIYGNDKPYHYDIKQGVSAVIYGILVLEQKVSIDLHLLSTSEKETAPADTGAIENLSQPQCTTDAHELEGIVVQTIDDLAVVYEGVNANA